MKFWIVSSKHSRDSGTEGWDSKWTADNFLRKRLFYPSRRETAFSADDRCILKVFGAQEFIGDFRIAGPGKRDAEGHLGYPLDDVNAWDFLVSEQTLPRKYRDQLSRSPTTEITEQDYYELLGIRNFAQNLRLNYKNRLRLRITEHDIESFLDTKDALRSRGLEIVERQIELSPGNRIDLLCKDDRGDLVVVELKKGSANTTVGQLARYVTDVREHRANSTQKVRGLILTVDVDEQLVKAARGVDFDVALCQLTFG